MINGEHHYERVIAPHIDYALEHVRSQPSALLWELMLGLIRKRGLAAPALMSAWAELAAEVRLDEAFVEFMNENPRGRAIYETSEKVGKAANLGARVHGESITQAMVAWQTARFRKAGRHTLAPSDGLAQRLMLTELRGIRGDDLRLPFQTVYVRIPAELGFRIWNTDTDWHPATGMYVSEDVQDGDRGLRILICAAGCAEGDRPDEFDDALAHFFVPLVDDEPVEKALSDFADMVLRPKVEANRTATERNLPDDGHDLAAVVDSWKAMFRWMMNVVFYATSPDCERDHVEGNEVARRLWARIQKLQGGSKNKKRVRLIQEHRAQPTRPRLVLGGSVKVDRTLPTSTGVITPGARSDMFAATLVSGHWQRFAVGVGRTDRVWKFRAPFWRGDLETRRAEGVEHELGDES